MIGVSKDYQRIFNMIKYCEKIDLSAKVFKNNYKKFIDNKNYQARDLCSFYIFQLGELSVGLSDEFKEQYKQIPWRDIRGIRNVVAHKYGTVDIETVWEVIIKDVPELNRKCRDILKEKVPNFDKDLKKELDLETGKSIEICK